MSAGGAGGGGGCAALPLTRHCHIVYYSNFIIYIRVRGVRAAVRAARQTPPEAAHSAAGVGVGMYLLKLI